MAESREKSEQFRTEFERKADVRQLSVTHNDDGTYFNWITGLVWDFVQWAEKIGRAAGRRDALEELTRLKSLAKYVAEQYCHSIGGKPASVGILWREFPELETELPKAAAIRALLEKP